MEKNKPIMYYNILTSTVKLHRRYIIFIQTCVEENGQTHTKMKKCLPLKK